MNRPPDPGGLGALPRRERLAAIAAPALALALGASVPRSRVSRLLIDGVIVGSLASALALRSSSRPRTIKPVGRLTDEPADPAAKRSPRIHVLVPARNEAAVIGDLVRDLGDQDLRDDVGAPAFRVTIVDDRSTDGTGNVAQQAIRAAGLGAAASVLRRDGGHDGKGAALATVSLDAMDDDAIVLVLDADARLTPGTLAGIVDAFGDGVSAITARRRTMLPPDGRRHWLAVWQDDEQTVDGAIQTARRHLGGAAELRGNGMAVRCSELRRIGGWDPDALCEDLEATTRLAVMGRKTGDIRWCPEVEIWEQPAIEARALLRQRLRWAEGAIRRDLRVTWPAVFRAPMTARRRTDLAAYAAQMLVPWLALGLATRSRQAPARDRLLALALAYVGGTGTIALLALPSPARVPGVLAVGAIWPVVLPIAWLRVALSRGPLSFARTKHRAGFNPPARPDGPAEADPRSPRANDRR